MVNWAILTVLVSFLATYLFKKAAYIPLPPGKRLAHDSNGINAITIVGNNVPSFARGFIVNGNKIYHEDLALSCNLAIHSVIKSFEKFGIGEPIPKKKRIKNCVFYFMDSVAFDRIAKINTKEKVYAFSLTTKKNMFGKCRTLIIIDSVKMHSVISFGQIIINELTGVLKKHNKIAIAGDNINLEALAQVDFYISKRKNNRQQFK